MNFLSTVQSVTSPLSPGVAPIGLPALDNGAALARLGGVPGGFDTPSLMSPSLLQMSVQLLAILTTLMLGQPNSAGARPGPVDPLSEVRAANDSNGISNSGGRIDGGKELYSKGKGMFHKGAKGAPDTYAFENSPAGIKFAAEHGYASIDIDMQITKDGVPVATHWSQPMEKDGFYDPEHKIKPGTKVSQMTLAEVMRLRNKDGQSRIYPVSTMVGELKKHGIAGDFEAKNDPRFATDQVMGYLANLVRNSGIKANLKSIDYGERSMKILKTAQQHGFWVRTATGNGKDSRNIGYAD